MCQSRFWKSFLLIGWLLVFVNSAAQTPASDLDSITEDSYRRMLDRQKAESVSDSLLLIQELTEIEGHKSKPWPRWYYSLGFCVSLVIVLVYTIWKKSNK